MDFEGLNYAWIVLCVVFAVSTIANIGFTAQTLTSHLPIPTATIVLPWLLSLVQLAQSAWLLYAVKIRVNLVIGVAWITSILDGVLIALASYQQELQNLDCALERTWRQWFQNKDANAIRKVQNVFQCCGFRSPVDQAWPFPDRDHDANACQQTYHRDESCYEGWSRATSTALFCLSVIGTASLVLKAFLYAWVQLRRSHRQSSHTRWSSNSQERRALLSTRAHEESYHDEASADVETER